jgi:hypothetical protein
MAKLAADEERGDGGDCHQWAVNEQPRDSCREVVLCAGRLFELVGDLIDASLDAGLVFLTTRCT